MASMLKQGAFLLKNLDLLYKLFVMIAFVLANSKREVNPHGLEVKKKKKKK